MTTARALIIDDEPDIRELLSITLDRMEIQSDTAADITQAKKLLENKNYNLCLTDMKLPDGNGIDLVKYIQKQLPDLPVAVITAHGSIDIAIEAMKAGAFDFINKPIELGTLRKLVESAISVNRLQQANDKQPDITGESPLVKL